MVMRGRTHWVREGCPGDRLAHPARTHGPTARVELPAAAPAADGRGPRCGSPVVEATTQGGGYTPGLASVLRCADGSRHFVKAASTKAQAAFAASYREEARKLADLPPGAPAPRLLWVHDADDWVVLGLEHVEARPPRRPWREDELDGVAGHAGAGRRGPDAAAGRARASTPSRRSSPTSRAPGSTWPGSCPTCRTGRRPRRSPPATARWSGARTLVHTDVRDDNILLRPDGGALLCDWNWPCLGPAWLDTRDADDRPARGRAGRGRRCWRSGR